jgi:DNA-directed RNA polymerase specialized sigma24 family protein
LAAAHDASVDSRPALTRLCEAYWPPVYAFIRRSGYDPDQSQDLTQAFFALLIEKNFLGVVDPQRGRFRSFLLTAVKRFLMNEHDRNHALKRGAGQVPLSLDLNGAETSGLPPSADSETPEKLFERRWALSLLERVMTGLRNEFAASGKAARFEALLPLLNHESSERYEELAVKMGLSAGALRALVHRMRRRYRDLMRMEIAETVAAPEEIDDEIRFLLRVLSS